MRVRRPFHINSAFSFGSQRAWCSKTPNRKNQNAWHLKPEVLIWKTLVSYFMLRPLGFYPFSKLLDPKDKNLASFDPELLTLRLSFLEPLWKHQLHHIHLAFHSCPSSSPPFPSLACPIRSARLWLQTGTCKAWGNPRPRVDGLNHLDMGLSQMFGT